MDFHKIIINEANRIIKAENASIKELIAMTSLSDNALRRVLSGDIKITITSLSKLMLALNINIYIK